MEKKIIAVIAALSIVIGLTGCGTKITKMNGEALSKKEATSLVESDMEENCYSLTEFDSYLRRTFMTEEDQINAKKLIVVDYKKNAKERLEKGTADEDDHKSKYENEWYLRQLGFTSEEASYAIENAKIDYNERALKAFYSYIKTNEYYFASNNVSTDQMIEMTKESLITYSHFTDEEVEYAIEHYKTSEETNRIKIMS